MNARETLIQLSLSNNCNWADTYRDIRNKKTVKELTFPTTDLITVLDEEYPERSRQVYNPAFMFRAMGDKTLLQSDIIGVVGTNAQKLLSNKAFAKKLKENNQAKAVFKNNTIVITKGAKQLVIDSVCGSLEGLFASLCSAIVMQSKKKLPREVSVVMNALNINTELYCVPTTTPSWSNTLIKEGANLIDSPIDLEK